MGLDQTKIRNLGKDWILAQYPDADIITTNTGDAPNSAAAVAVPSSAAWILPAAVLAIILGAGFS
jgi:hypothetical protein